MEAGADEHAPRRDRLRTERGKRSGRVRRPRRRARAKLDLRGVRLVARVAPDRRPSRRAPSPATGASRSVSGSTRSSSSSIPTVNSDAEREAAHRCLQRGRRRDPPEHERGRETARVPAGRDPAHVPARRADARRDAAPVASTRSPPSVVVIPATTSTATAPSSRRTGAPARSAAATMSPTVRSRTVVSSARRDV